MGLFKLSAFLFLLSAQAYCADILNEVEEAFVTNKIVPTIIDSVPAKLFDVRYDEEVVNLGNELPVTSVVFQPTFKWDADPNTYYTIFMIGYPVKPEINLEIAKSVRHMHLINILGNDVSSGKYLAAYLQPLPPPLSGSQRYTFLLYKQDDYLDLPDSFFGKYTLDRFNYNVTEFVNDNNLTLEAGNFFITSVSTLLKNPLSILGI